MAIQNAFSVAEIAQLGERQTEDLRGPGSNPENSHESRQFQFLAFQNVKPVQIVMNNPGTRHIYIFTECFCLFDFSASLFLLKYFRKELFYECALFPEQISILIFLLGLSLLLF